MANEPAAEQRPTTTNPQGPDMRHSHKQANPPKGIRDTTSSLSQATSADRASDGSPADKESQNQRFVASIEEVRRALGTISRWDPDAPSTDDGSPSSIA